MPPFTMHVSCPDTACGTFAANTTANSDVVDIRLHVGEVIVHGWFRQVNLYHLSCDLPCWSWSEAGQHTPEAAHAHPYAPGSNAALQRHKLEYGTCLINMPLMHMCRTAPCLAGGGALQIPTQTPSRYQINQSKTQSKPPSVTLSKTQSMLYQFTSQYTVSVAVTVHQYRACFPR